MGQTPLSHSSCTVLDVGVSNPACNDYKISRHLRCSFLATREVWKKAKGHITCVQKRSLNSSSFQALPTFTYRIKRLESEKGHWQAAPLGGGRRKTGGRVRWNSDGGVATRGLTPPPDKLELQTVETCEIRMEPSLRGWDLRDRARSRSTFTDKLLTLAASVVPRFAFIWPHLSRGGNGLKWWV